MARGPSSLSLREGVCAHHRFPPAHPFPRGPPIPGPGPRGHGRVGDSQTELPFSRRTVDMKVGKIKEQRLLRGTGDRESDGPELN